MTTIKTVFEKLKQSRHLPQLPQVMLKLVKACNSDSVSTEELTDIIAADPALTSKLLQILGSPYVNLPQEVTSIKSAVVFLGLDTIRNMAISSSAMHFFSLARKRPEFNMGKFWYHSYKCGITAEKLAREQGLSNPDEYFLAGLLHDIGRLALIQTFPDAYARILAKGGSENEMAAAEMAAFQTDTAQVSAWLFRNWHLNPLMADAVMFINETADKIQGELSHIKAVYAANQLSGPDDLDGVAGLSDLLEIPEARLGQMAAEAENEVLTMARHMGIRLEKEAPQGADRDIAHLVKDSSLIFGTLENLLAARDRNTVFRILENGFRIVFSVPRLFFFFWDEKKKLLSGTCSRRDKNHRIVKSVALSASGKKSLILRSVHQGRCRSCFETHGTRAISDVQIIRLLETEGFYTIPVRAKNEVMGVMVLGVDQETARTLDANAGLVNIISRQAGICLENLRFHREYADNVNQKKMEAYATVTDKVIHEINNPMAIIKNYLESLSLKLPEAHPAQEELSVVREEMSRVSLLLDGLSSFSKPKISGFDLVDVNRLCARMAEILKKSMLLPRQITATLVTDPDLPEILTDPNGMKQVLINLIKNCAEAMGQGGKIEIRTRFVAESAKVLIGEKKRLPGHIEIRITDNGPGIPQDIMERLFEPYNSSKTGNRNAGLGLAIVHSIIKELNGRIRCDSQIGKGTRFSILLPVDGAEVI